MAAIGKPGPKFPQTRLLEAIYKDIVPQGCQNDKLSKSIDDLINLASKSPITETIETPRKFDSFKTLLATKISELRASTQQQENDIRHTLPSIKALLSAAQDEPSSTSVSLTRYSSGSNARLVMVKRCSVLECCECSKQALPYTRHCLKHIHLSKEQLLYKTCSNTDPMTKTQCKNAVLDLLSSQHTCLVHYKHADLASKRGLKPPGPRSKLLKPPAKRNVSITTPKTPLKQALPQDTQAPEASPPTQAQKQSSTEQQQQDMSDQTIIQNKNSLDDLLTLGMPIQSLDLPPLEADIGDIMMAGEESD